MSTTPVLIVLTDGEESLARSLDEVRQDGWKVYASGRVHDVATFLNRNPDALFLVRGALLPSGREEQTLAACVGSAKRPFTILARPAASPLRLDGIDEEIVEPFTASKLIEVLDAAKGPPAAPAPTLTYAAPPPIAEPETIPPPPTRTFEADETPPIDPIGADGVRLLKWIRRCTEDERNPKNLQETALRALTDLTGSREGRLYAPVAGSGLRLLCAMGVAESEAESDRLRAYAAEAAADGTPRVIMGVPKSGASGVMTSHLVVPLVDPGSVKAVAVLSDRAGIVPYGMSDIEAAVHLGRQLGENFTNAEQRVDLEQKATIDYATGLFTRYNFDLNLPKAFNNAQRQGVPLSLMFIDVDNLKKWNDEVSYEAGSAVLARIGEILATSFRMGDMACRYGGDEMVVILPKAARGTDGTSVLAEKIRATIAAQRISVAVNGRDVVVAPTVSIGYATYPRDATTPEGLFAAADAAVKQAKKIKNSVCYADALRP